MHGKIMRLWPPASSSLTGELQAYLIRGVKAASPLLTRSTSRSLTQSSRRCLTSTPSSQLKMSLANANAEQGNGPKQNAWVGSAGAAGYDLRTLRSLLTQPPHGLVCDYRSHIVKYEAGGVSALTGATVKTIVPKNGIYLSLEDIKANVYLDDDVHTCPTRLISLENTLNGMIMPLQEVQRISAFAKENGLKMHCDGARLWEAAASGAGSLKEFASCFDTVTLCFSKGLGAPIGSILVGDKKVIKHSRWVRKSIGGGLRQSGVVTAAARVAVDETFGKGPNGEVGLLRDTHILAQQVAKIWTDLGGQLIHPVHTNMVWLDLEDAHCPDARVDELGKEAGLKLMGGRLVIHYQIYQNREFVVPRLESIFKTIMGEKNGTSKGLKGQEGERSMYRTSQ
ncbi:hypothetical protein QC764_102060 [Podospora pseudoanserina]|uniref:Aromatic amino acid beta-eliminating lyase/threonine aldolase domain-containing protein n=1 Tax=Podospora pseudoanserina TaxID=2609844 RepID=A0ABR0IK65_9PEZI|nr:hypothetical protein QC764_102060 [Podospora pseudoanserina]